MDLSEAQHQLHHHYLNHQLHHQQQEMDSQSLDSIIACSKQSMDSHQSTQEKNSNPNPNLKPRPADNEAQKCPRCDSTNTKFCYYNNYSLSQPRYFCKSCRRYWTKGGTLRNVPVGGGCRKSTHNKRPSSPNSSIFLLKRANTHDVTPTTPPHSNPAPAPFYGSGYASLTDCDGLLPNPQAFGFLDSLRHGNGSGLFQTLCYGAGEAVSVPFDDVAAGVGNAVMKQENEGRALWGFPWQVNSYGESVGAAAVAADVEPNLRGSWNGLIGNSAWQGLLNSPALI